MEGRELRATEEEAVLIEQCRNGNNGAGTPEATSVASKYDQNPGSGIAATGLRPDHVQN